MITTVNNQTIYNFLKEKTQGFKINFDFGSLQELKLSLERALLIEEGSKTSTKQRVRFCLDYSKSRYMQKKPILQYTCQDQIENTQIFTDSYFMVFLKDDDKLPIPDYKSENKDWQYPNTKLYYKSKNDIELSQYNITFNINKIMNYFKLKDFITINTNIKSSFDYDIKVALDKDVFKRFYMFMNYKESENITLYFQKTTNNFVRQPLYAAKDNNSTGLLLPCYKDEEADNTEVNITDLQ